VCSCAPRHSVQRQATNGKQIISCLIPCHRIQCPVRAWASTGAAASPRGSWHVRFLPFIDFYANCTRGNLQFQQGTLMAQQHMATLLLVTHLRSERSWPLQCACLKANSKERPRTMTALCPMRSPLGTRAHSLAAFHSLILTLRLYLALLMLGQLMLQMQLLVAQLPQLKTQQREQNQARSVLWMPHHPEPTQHETAAPCMPVPCPHLRHPMQGYSKPGIPAALHRRL
jgi:hypothetical protein